jgi:hypothetical protein
VALWVKFTSSNSLLGTIASDKVGSYGIEALNLGNYLVFSADKITTSTYRGGAVTWGLGTTGTVGDLSFANSLLGGGTASYAEQLGSGRALVLSDGRALVLTNYGRVSGVSNAGRMDILSYTPPATLIDASAFANNSSLSQQLGAVDIKASMDSGTPVTLQASNDITISSAITGTNSAGHLTLQAGRSILINANITTGGANLTLKANETLASGVVDVQRDTGAASINMASGTTINAGTGSITMSLGAGTGLTNNTSGDVTLRTLTAASVSVINSGNTSGSSITANNNITASNSVRLEADYGSVTVAGNAMAAGGSAVMLARDDITINAAMTSPANSTGSLSMLAGRSVLINQAIDTKNGAITVKANYSDNTDSVSDTRLPGSAAVSAIVTNGNISAGTGAVDIRVMNGAGLTTTDSSSITSDAITLRTLTGGDVTVINDGPTLGASSISNPSGNITSKGHVLLKASRGSISVTGITTDGTVTPSASITLLAMDDIANNTRAITNTSSNGTVTLRAGRSVNLTQNITTPSDVTISANTPYDASFGVSASRTPGAASLSITGSVRATDISNQSFINGNVSIALGDGYGLSDNTAGTMSLSGVYGRNVNIVHNGTSGNGITLTGAVLPYGLYNSGTNALISSGSTSVVANYGSITATGGSSYGGSGDSTVVFRARDDITISTLFVDRSSTFGTDPGGLMQLLAGRSVILNSELNTKGSSLTIRANYFDNTSTVSSTRLPGDAVITMGGSYGAIRPIGGDVTIAVMDGTGLSTTDSSAITSGNVILREIPNARNLTVTNNGPTPGSGIVVGAGGLGMNSTGGTSGAGRTGPITGLINLSTFNGDITLQGNIATASTASGAITLIAGTAASAPTTTGGEIILSGTGTRTITTGTGGSALLFAGSSAGSTGLAALATPVGTFYNVDPANMPPSGVTTGIYALFRQNTLPLTLTLDNTSMIYGDAYPTLPTFTLTGGSFNAGDSITSIAWGSAATAFKAQGTYAYSTANLLAPTFNCAAAGCSSNYSLTFVNGLTISPRPITVAADAKSMTYGGTVPALTYQITSGNMVNGDLLTGALARTAGTHAGTYPISVGTLAASSNYAVTYSPANFVIDPAVLTVSMTNTGVTKTYDGTYAAPVGFTPTFSVAGLITGDSAATVFYSAAGYNDPHVLAANRVTASPLSITSITSSNGSLSTDYVLSATNASVPATITPVAVTVSSATIGGTLSKTYDGTTTATGATVSGTVTGGITGDTLNLSTNGMTLAYSSPRAGSSTISASGTPGLLIASSTAGSLPSDYSFTAPTITDAAATITPQALTISAAIGGSTSKTYDGTTAAPGANVTGSVSGAVAGDSMSLNTSAVTVAYNSAHVASATTLRASGAPSLSIGASSVGSVASDYTYSIPTIADVPGTITPKALTATASIGGTLSKTYDGSAAAPGASIVSALTGAIAGDNITLNTAGITLAYNSAHVADANSLRASGNPILVMGSSASGSVASDYSYTAPIIADVAGSITPKVLVASLTNTDVSKPFDGTVTPPVGFTTQFALSGFIAGDSAASVTGNSAYNSADPMTANAVVVSSMAIGAITGANGSRSTDYALDAAEKSVAAKIIQLPPALPPVPQSTATTTSAVNLSPETSKDKEIAVATAAVSAVSAQTVPQIRTAAVLSFGTADVGMELVVTPVASSLTLAETPATEGQSKDDTEIKTNSVGLFTQTGTTVAAGGALSIVEQGRNIRASSTTAPQSAPASLNLTGMRYVNVDYKLPSGGQNQMSVGVSSDGVLVVKVPAAMMAASDDRSLALIGMATAKERLDVQPANVKGVVIQVE